MSLFRLTYEVLIRRDDEDEAVRFMEGLYANDFREALELTDVEEVEE